MAEAHPREDEATRYVFGQLSPAEQGEFETQLAQSAELRALVQELEAGMEALARAVPQQTPPPKTWLAIKQTIRQEAEEKIVAPAYWTGWWRNGWAAAAACLLGWLGFAVWHHQVDKQPATASFVTTESVPALRPADPVESTIPLLTNPNLTAANPSRELNVMRQQMATLQTQVLQLSNIAERQRAIMLEPGRFKMFPMATNATSASAVALSPELQRALFYAMARELGWLPAPSPIDAQNNPATANATNHLGVDFVDLIPPTNNPTATVETQLQEDEGLDQFHIGPASVGSSGTIPGFQSGTNLVLAFDSTTTPSGSLVNFWKDDLWIGGTVTGENPTVVTIPTSTSPGWNITVTTSSGSGASNVIGHFFSH